MFVDFIYTSHEISKFQMKKIEPFTCFPPWFSDVFFGRTRPRQRSKLLLSHFQLDWSIYGGKDCVELHSRILLILESVYLYTISHLNYLPCSSISSEKCKVCLEPVVDFIEGQLSSRRFIDGLADEGSVGEWRPDVGAPVEVSVLTHLRLHVQAGVLVKFEGGTPSANIRLGVGIPIT